MTFEQWWSKHAIQEADIIPVLKLSYMELLKTAWEASQQDAYEYAKRLAVSLWEEDYKGIEWEPPDDLMGVLTQLDNMVKYINKNKGSGPGGLP